jgi:tRNA threonylcarbamoyladenosine biosynthesis protein TsaE
MLHLDVHESGEISVYLGDEPATLELGAHLGRALPSRLIVYLRGDLGAGKTTLARGMLRGLGYAGQVKSPSYTLVEVYRLSSLYLHHFDFYRFKDPAEWIDAGFREVFGDDNVCLVEWPEKAGVELPSPDLELSLEHLETGRTARLTAHTAAGIECLRRLIG